MTPDDILDAVNAGENADWEFKDARGGLPDSVWPTVSAMANTDGGVIVLGVEDRDGTWAIVGVPKAAKLKQQFWNAANNPQKLNRSPFASDSAVTTATVGAAHLVIIRVPRAPRKLRPVSIGANPLTGTYRRQGEGDYRCRADEVGRMLADQSDESADARVLPHFGIADLDPESVRQYRNRFSARHPTHAWLTEDTAGFLQKLRGWRRDREANEEGLTVAGLLMFGTEDALNDPATGLKPHLDYRERVSDAIADRWHDRVTVDGTWVPNLFQFFQRVYPRLTSGLKLPFAYQATTTTPAQFPDPLRVGMSPAHEALQEGLVNALIHADFRGQGGVVLDRFPGRIEMSNPGTLLVSQEQLRQGGVSECRNPSLQKMFQMMGAGDKAGSGYDKIRRGWELQHWRQPYLFEASGPDRVTLELPMVSLLPPESLGRLETLFGPQFTALSPTEVQILVTAELEGEVSNARMQLLCEAHPADLTSLLRGLVEREFLTSAGKKRSYRLPSPSRRTLGSPHSGGDSPHNEDDSPHSGGDSPHNEDDSSHYPGEVTPLPPDGKHLLSMAAPYREKGRRQTAETRHIILALCEGRFLEASQLAGLLDRDPGKLRDRFLTPLTNEGKLLLRYPAEKNHPRQAYTVA